jgi:protein-S-isoprenylcysteine O-methyltransferase Ste14
MLMAVRHLVSFLLLPFTVAVVIPLVMARNRGITLPHSQTLPWTVASVLVLAAGVALFVSSLYEFVTRGRGTLAPWDPPRELVVRGPYRFVRNPMISGVVCILIGESLMLHSRPHLWWAATFTAINCVYIPLLEEPQLLQRFGDAYGEYCTNVPRLIPRFTPWTQ